jgi:thiamine-monophosphate kinase
MVVSIVLPEVVGVPLGWSGIEGVPAIDGQLNGVKWLLEFAMAFASIAKSQGVAVLGGDMSKGKQLVINVTVFGTLDGRLQVTRDGARSGDVIALAGEQGFSLTGYNFLSGKYDERLYPPELVQIAKNRFLCPEPPYFAGVEANEAGATSMMDVSDGLIKDAGRLARASEVTFQFNKRRHDDDSITEWISDEDYYNGGEDHTLLATFPRGVLMPLGFNIIGNVIDAQGSPTELSNLVIGDDISALQEQDKLHLWDHFTS